MRIIGIDPGSVFCGYGVIESNKIKNSIEVVEYGTIEVKKKFDNINFRMKEIYERISAVISRTKPDFASIENVFYSKNVQSLIKLTMARSAAILAIVNQEIPVSEYSAREVKRSVTGKGNANKEQISFMVKSLLNIKESPEFFDTTDALAIAICHSNNFLNFSNNNLNNNSLKNGDLNSNSEKTRKKSNNWSKFIQENPDKILKL
jgi:crossover junction endodeoxyribonuclease RuvC